MAGAPPPPPLTPGLFLCKVLFLFKRAVEFVDSVFVSSFDFFFRYLNGAVSCFKSSFIFFSFKQKKIRIKNDSQIEFADLSRSLIFLLHSSAASL